MIPGVVSRRRPLSEPRASHDLTVIGSTSTSSREVLQEFAISYLLGVAHVSAIQKIVFLQKYIASLSL